MPWPYPDDNPFPTDPGRIEPGDEDTDLANRVAQRLAGDWTTRRQQITVTVQNRVVILSGMVTDAEARQVARELAWDEPGVFDVCNALAVSTGRRGRR